MTLPRKGSRAIHVGSRSYRWSVAGVDEPEFGFVVELDDEPAQLLVVRVGLGRVVTPAIVASAIETAIASGRAPNEQRSDYVLESSQPPPETGERMQCPCCDYFALGVRGMYEICPVCF